MQPLLILKVDVDTLRGTREGVPPLMQLFARAGAQATFLFSVGPDNTGRALRRAFRPGFLSKVSRTSVLEHYGLRTLLYGTLLVGPHIGRRAGDTLRAARDAGFEVGLHTHDHVRWQDFVADRDAAWAEAEMQRGIDAYAEVFGAPPTVHGAAGWQMNDGAFRYADTRFTHASDTRGTHPFLPVIDGQTLTCPQLPTTLPTLDELIGLDGTTPENVADRVLALTRDPPAHGQGHVFTLHAELEGMRLLPVMAQLIAGWKRQGYALGSMGQLAASLDVTALPRHRVVREELPGRSGELMGQGAVVA